MSRQSRIAFHRHLVKVNINNIYETMVAHKGHAFSVEIYCCSVEIDLLRALPAVLRANLSGESHLIEDVI